MHLLHRLELRSIPPIGVSQVLPPVSMHIIKGGSNGSAAAASYVFDLGQNIAGVVRLEGVGRFPEGTQLTLRHRRDLSPAACCLPLPNPNLPQVGTGAVPCSNPNPPYPYQGYPPGPVCSEILNGDGSVQNTYCSWPCPTTCGQADGGNCANQTDVYIASASATASSSWEPQHTYHGFRYVQIEGWPPSLPPPQLNDTVTGPSITPLQSPLFNHPSRVQTHVHRALCAFPGAQPRLDPLQCLATGPCTPAPSPPAYPEHGSTLWEVLNSLQRAVRYTQLANLHSIPTDCPQREKRGWMGVLSQRQSPGLDA